jgi:hypothetical protein
MRALTVLALILCSAPGFAWGPEGHRLIARMAQDRLTPPAAARVAATLAPGETIASMASWADDIRPARKETEPWHFIDIEITSSGLDMKRDCPAAGCVVRKIEEFRKRWRDETLSPAERREALLFLVHFVGDMHQPLHCADNHDRGGNDRKVEFEGAHMNLHRLWDSALLDRLPPEVQLFATLEGAITLADQAEWIRGTVEIWAGESFEVARQVVYGALPKAPQGAVVHLNGSYERIADPVIQRQVEKAAVRLAAILNEMP